MVFFALLFIVPLIVFLIYEHKFLSVYELFPIISYIFIADSACVLCNLKVCDDRYSELIPCLSRDLIYQLRLKLDLSLMEHYERHCPPAERRFNCLIPPPHGYKV